MHKDFSDYCICVFGFRVNPRTKKLERIYHKMHIDMRFLADYKSGKREPQLVWDEYRRVYRIPWNGHTYGFDPSKAVQLKKWIPWQMMDQKHLFRSIREVFRKKRIGLVHAYQEELP